MESETWSCLAIFTVLAFLIVYSISAIVCIWVILAGGDPDRDFGDWFRKKQRPAGCESKRAKVGG